METLQTPLYLPQPSSDERRGASRFMMLPDSEFAAVWSEDQDARVVEVHDESLGGLGLIFPATFDVIPGMEFHVVYTSNHFHGHVRHLRRLADGRQLVGLACERKR